MAVWGDTYELSGLQCKSYHKVGLLGAGVGGHLGKHRNAERIGDLQVLGGLQAYVGNSKAVGVAVERCGVGHGADAGLPIASTQFEGR